MKTVRHLRLLAIAGIVVARSAGPNVPPASADIPEKFTNLKVMPKEISKQDSSPRCEIFPHRSE